MAQSMLYIRGRFVLKTDYCTPNEIEEEKSRLRKANYAQMMREAEEAERMARRGICPCCHLVLPFNGQCDCGYKRK